MEKVLIITHTQDNDCVRTVSEAIVKNGGEAIRLDVDLYPTGIELTALQSNDKRELWLTYGDNTYPLHECTSLWFRRFFNMGKALATELEEEYLQPALEESRRALLGMIEGFDGFCFGKFSEYRRLDSREEQMAIAVRVGLNIPATCVTNSPEQVRRFIKANNGRVIGKMQSSFAIYREGVEHVMFTNRISEADLEDMDGLKYSPMMFQQEIEKKLELRVTITGDKIFTYAIDSQQSEKAKVDWRKDGYQMMGLWVPYQLPADIEAKLLQFMDIYGVNYGAIDIILTPDDQYYFLEINAAGEFFWIDMLCEYQISDHISKILLGKAFRRE
jgi:hypothetical protein